MNRLQAHLTGLVCAAGLSAVAAAQDGPIPVEIRGEPGNFMLYRGGEPYHVRGAGR